MNKVPHRNFILDIGCGEGIKIERLLVRGTYVGIDPDINNVKAVNAKFKNISVIVGSAERLPFRDNIFDEIHAYDVLEHVHDLKKSCQEIMRCLDNGRLLVIEVPYYKSENMLLHRNPNYWKEVGHLRMVEKYLISEEFPLFRIRKIQKKRGMQHLLLWYYFVQGGKIVSDRGTCSNANPIMDRIGNLFDEDYLCLFLLQKHSSIKWLFFPLLVGCHLGGRLISMIFPKTLRFELEKV